jgi:GNAT superfamily N-acetyltransferase
MAEQLSFSIQSATYADVNAIFEVGRDAMSYDRQTQLKYHGNVPYLQPDSAKQGIISLLSNPKGNFIKAISNDTGDLLGACSFFFHGFESHEIPASNPGELDESLVKGNETPESLPREMASVDEEKQKAIDKINALDAMESKDMQRWQKILMPPGSKCIILTGFSVNPKYQGRGIGGQLLKRVTDLADERGVFMWVHSSEAAVRTYMKGGFEVVGTLEVDLDDYATAPPPEGEGVPWGRYTIRYMKRMPVTER